MTAASSVSLKRGALYVSCEVYDRYFAGLEAVILLRRDRDLCILPVRHAAAGGYLLKLRNKAGDRVVHAPDFFRECGIDESVDAGIVSRLVCGTRRTGRIRHLRTVN